MTRLPRNSAPAHQDPGYVEITRKWGQTGGSDENASFGFIRIDVNSHSKISPRPERIISNFNRRRSHNHRREDRSWAQLVRDARDSRLQIRIKRTELDFSPVEVSRAGWSRW